MSTKQTKQKCPYCGGGVVCKDSSIVYGKSYGKIWICSNWPKCDAYVGCQKGSEKPLGRLANQELRYWKKQAHSKFDKLWESGEHMNRSRAYAWLSGTLGIPPDKCHIGMFDVDQCKAVCDAVREFQKSQGN
jgi:ssDNA-binding Zn-finger/Zn-ribbon topoisomerase 1